MFQEISQEPTVFRFRHEAMATVFEVRIRGDEPDRSYYEQAAQEVFRELDRIEGLLSRFREGSDIFRINHLAEGEGTRMSFECAECLMIAAKVKEATGGAFEPAIGGVMQQLRGEIEGASDSPEAIRPTLHTAFEAMDQGAFVFDGGEILCARSGAVLDLGAIGKGYALDHAVPMLQRWGIEDALLIGGGSSVRSLGEVGWEVDLAGNRSRRTERLVGRSIGGSGTSVQGCHIVDPRRKTLELKHRRAWALADSAAVADALSTAAMTMSVEEIAEALSRVAEGLGERCQVYVEPWEEGTLLVVGSEK